MSAPLLLYRLAMAVAAVLALPYGIYRSCRRLEEMRERFGFAPRSETNVDSAAASPRVWIHAASLGEVEAVRVWLGERPFREEFQLVLTVTSTSARCRARERLGGAVAVRFAPIDLDGPVRRFLDREEPRALVLVETELWPVTLDLCRRRGVPVYVVSGRVSDRGWGRMRRVAPLYRAVASAVRAAAVQSEVDAERFRFLGFSAIEVCGNLKYGGAAVRGAGTGIDGREAAGGVPQAPPLWTIGSLRKGEEALLAAARALIPEGWAVVLAPRHLREREHWLAACVRAGLRPLPRSAGGWSPEEGVSTALARGRDGAGLPVFLLDAHGELQKWYERSTAATVGGTWVPVGGHNIFEPVEHGVPVSFGPFVANVRDVAAVLLAEGAGACLAHPEELASWVRAQRAPGQRQKAERSALCAARKLAGAGERTRACLSAAGAAEAGDGIIRP